MPARLCGPNLLNQLPETLSSSDNQETFEGTFNTAEQVITTNSQELLL